MSSEHTEQSSSSLYGRAIGAGLVGLAAIAGDGGFVAPAQAIISTYDLKAAKKFHDGGGTDMYLKFGVSVAAGDLDGDGVAELVVGSTNGVSNTLDYFKFFRPQPGRSEEWTYHKGDIPPAVAGTLPTGIRVAAGDLNGDGLADVVVGNPTPDGMKLRAAGGPYLKITLQDVVVSSWGVNVATGDLDGDGQAEIFTAPPGPAPGSTASAIRRNSVSGSKGKFGDITEYMKFAGEYAVYGSSYTGGIRVATGDVDNDGVADLVTLSEGTASRSLNFTKIKWDAATGEASYIKYDGFSIDAPSPSTAINIAAGDVNGDGLCDIVLGIAGGPGGGPRVDVYRQVPDATGGLEATWALDPALSLSSTELNFPSDYTGPLSIALGNFVGDSSLDLIVANAAPVPEPAALAVLSSGAVALLGRRRRRPCAVQASS